MRALWSLNEDILKIIDLKNNTPYPSRRYEVSVPAFTKRPLRIEDQYAVSRRPLYAVFKIWHIIFWKISNVVPTPRKAQYADYDWYEALEDSELKDLALRNKASMEGLINDDDNDEREELCEVYKPPVCKIRKYRMIKYSFNYDEEYVAVKEDEYDDLTITEKEACQAYQEIFRMIDKGWKDLVKGISTNIGEEFSNLEDLEVLES
ncbi:hypothetical protein Tco_1331957 [Tanacetum coccineum]